MKILKLVTGNDDGGVFTSEYNFIQSFRRKGVIVDLVIVGKGDRTDAYKRIADRSLSLPALQSNLGGGVLKNMREIAKIRSFGSRYNKDVTVLNGPYAAIIYRRPIFIFLAGMVGKRLKAKVYWHMPNVASNKFSKIFYTLFLKRYRIIPVANSEYTKSTLSYICKDIIYPGFSVDRVKPVLENFKEELGIDEGEPVFGMAGRLCFDKAQDILIKAFLQSTAYKEGGHLILAGGFASESFRNELMSITGIQFDNQVHFLGRIDNMPKFYTTIDIALNARRNAEPFGISIAEGLAAGKPVMAYYLGGPSEMIEDGVTGWLVRNTDVQSWVSAFDVAIAARDKWQQMGREAARKVDKFDVENNTSKFLELIEK